MRTLSGAMSLLVLPLVLAACGGDDGGTGPGSIGEGEFTATVTGPDFETIEFSGTACVITTNNEIFLRDDVLSITIGFGGDQMAEGTLPVQEDLADGSVQAWFLDGHRFTVVGSSGTVELSEADDNSASGSVEFSGTARWQDDSRDDSTGSVSAEFSATADAC